MTRIEAVIQCIDCNTEVSSINAVEERPGFWINQPTVPVPNVCPVCTGVLIRKDHVEKFNAQRVHFERAKDESAKRKPGGAQHVSGR